MPAVQWVPLPELNNLTGEYMAVRKITIDRHETNHAVATIYATVFDNGLVDVRRSVRQKLDNNEHDAPDNRLTIEQHKFLLAQAAYSWLCAFCMLELTGTDPDMDWPGFHPGTCELCKREVTVFTTREE